MAWATPKSYAVGEVLTASDMNQYQRDNTIALRDPDRARATKASAQSIADSSGTTVDLDTEDYDHGNLYDPSGANPTRITIGEDGTYEVGCSTNWQSNSTGYRFAGVFPNGLADAIASDRRPGLNQSEQSPSNRVELVAGDYVEMIVSQTSGGALNLRATDDSPMLWVHLTGANP